MSVKIDDLIIDIQSSSTDAVSGIDALSASLAKLKQITNGGMSLSTVAKNLKGIGSAIDTMDDASNIDSVLTSLEKLKNLGGIKLSSTLHNNLGKIGESISKLKGLDYSVFTTMSEGLGKITYEGNQGFSSTLNALNKLPTTFGKIKQIDMGDFSSRMKELALSLEPLNKVMYNIGTSFDRLPNKIKQLANITDRATGSNKKWGFSYTELNNRVKSVVGFLKHTFYVLGGFVAESNKYIENLNLFNASMGQYTKEAKDYAELVGGKVGIDPSDWMRNQGIFQTMAEGFGVVSDRAYIMSKNMTQLGYDLSSFFNISFEEAMLKLQSGLAGELEPLRRLGYDLSQARLQAEALSLGINKSFNAMTQAEKAQIRYHAIMTQVTHVQGDMARTLNSPSNQLRIFSSQLKMAARSIGNIFIPILNIALPYLIAFAKVVRHVADVIAKFFGFELPKVDYSGLNKSVGATGDLADNIGDVGSGLGKASKEAKKLKNHLLGIDELNVISPDNNTPNIGGSGGGSGIGGAFDSGLDFELPQYDFLEGLIDSKHNTIFKKMKENLWEILTFVGAIGLGIGSWGLMSALNKLTPLNMGFKTMFGFATAIVGAFVLISEGINGWKNGIDTANLVGMLTGTAMVVGSLWLLFGKLGLKIGTVSSGIILLVTAIKDAITNGLNWKNGVLIPLGAALLGFGIGGHVGLAIGGFIGLLGVLAIALIQNFDKVKKFFSDLPSNIVKVFTGLSDKISGWFDKLWQPLKDYDWENLGHDVGVKLGKFLKKALIKGGEMMKNAPKFLLFDLPITLLRSVGSLAGGLSDVADAIVEGLFDGMVIAVKGIGKFINGLLDGLLEGLGISDGKSKKTEPIGKDMLNGLLDGMFFSGIDLKAKMQDRIIQPLRDKVKNSPLGEFAVGIKNDAHAWWNNCKTWWNEKAKQNLSVSALVGLVKKKWSTVGAWIVKHFMGGDVRAYIGLAKKGWDTVTAWVSKYITGSVSVSIKLVKGWVGKASKTIKKWLGLADGGVVTPEGIKMFSGGGIIPGYAGGTTRANHGSLFVAGESGAEMVAHLNGRTEVMNRFQIASVMKESIMSGMLQFVPHWKSVNSKLAECTNAVITAMSYDTSILASNLEKEPTYYNVSALRHTVDTDRNLYDRDDKNTISVITEFYRNNVETTLKRIEENTKKQADKREQTTVQIGNRVLTDVVDEQRNANGFVFTT